MANSQKLNAEGEKKGNYEKCMKCNLILGTLKTTWIHMKIYREGGMIISG